MNHISKTEQSGEAAPFGDVSSVINTAGSHMEKNPPAKMEEVSGVV